MIAFLGVRALVSFSAAALVGIEVEGCPRDTGRSRASLWTAALYLIASGVPLSRFMLLVTVGINPELPPRRLDVATLPSSSMARAVL